jgi:2-amino-4-hydroxy-6-hydroxymethyldihydropteridine diphosphokinase
VYIGIGSNVDPESNLKAAARLLRASFPGIAFSSVYETAPMYEEDQPTFLNAVAKFKTEQTVHDVHAVLVRIEKQLKKNSPKKYGPRTIDVDLLLYGNETMSAACTSHTPKCTSGGLFWIRSASLSMKICSILFWERNGENYEKVSRCRIARKKI